MSLLYLEEHTACGDYVSAVNTGFQFMNLGKGKHFQYNDEQRVNVLIFLIKGEAAIIRNGKQYTMKEGTIFLYEAHNKVKFSMEAVKDCHLMIHYFDIPIEFCHRLDLESLYRYISDNDINPDGVSFLPIHENISSDFIPPLKHLMDVRARCKHLIELKHQELFFYFRFFYTKQHLAEFFQPLLSPSLDFKQVVLANYSNATTAKHLAELCHYSEASFKAEFMKNFGETPYSWFSRQRLEAVKMKLKDVNTPFATIISDFNFSSPAHFTTYCKRNLGKTPKDWRREYIKNKQKQVFI